LKFWIEYMDFAGGMFTTAQTPRARFHFFSSHYLFFA